MCSAEEAKVYFCVQLNLLDIPGIQNKNILPESFHRIEYSYSNRRDFPSDGQPATREALNLAYYCIYQKISTNCLHWGLE